MADRAVCSIPKCDKSAVRRGWCYRHYGRWRAHGNPTAGGKNRPPAGASLKAIERAIAESVPSECWNWPLSENGRGYGQLWIDGVHCAAHRVICERVQGSPPSAQHEAAHTCGNGHLGCVNPHHLVWKTRLENDQDKKVHGTVGRGERNAAAKLSCQQVDEVRMLYAAGGITQHALANQFGVKQSAISRVISGKRWGWRDAKA